MNKVKTRYVYTLSEIQAVFDDAGFFFKPDYFFPIGIAKRHGSVVEIVEEDGASFWYAPGQEPTDAVENLEVVDMS